MIHFIRLFLLFTIFSTTCIFAAQDKNQRGNVIYSFKSGKIQCQSEINANQEITILLSPLKKNTKINFVEVKHSKKHGLNLKALMSVAEEKPICASWTDCQEVNIQINPTPVNTFTLTGKEVYNSNGIKVLVEDSNIF
jgi:hypothetical protein